MTYACVASDGPGYSTCQYGQSKLVFRGTGAEPDRDYIAFIGSTETFGKYVSDPFPDLVGEVLGRPTLNLGCVNAGLDTFCGDPTVQQMCGRASASVVQIMGAEKLSNRFYAVHRRRNDRFIAAHEPLRRLFPDVDFSGINFARHLIETLAAAAPERLQDVRDALCAAWMDRMAQLLTRLRGPVVLCWVSERGMDDGTSDPLAADPLFVTRDMVNGLVTERVRLVEVQYRTSEAPAPYPVPGPRCHFQVAAALSDALSEVL